MPKSRLNRKQIRRLKKKAGYSAEMQKLAYFTELTERIPNQSVLNAVLLQEPDPIRRKACFERMLPLLKFKNPIFPTTLEQPRIIIP